jgi:hypothetical protein
MGGFYSLMAMGPQLLVGLLVLGLFSSAVGRRIFAHKLVLRAYRISFEPLPEGSDVNGHPLSQPVLDLRTGEAIYAAIIGRPAGLINFLREGFGLGRRFEFALCKRQAIVRMGSLTMHSLQCTKLSSLGTCTVGQQRTNPLVLLFQFMVAAVVINGLAAGMMNVYEGYPLFTFLVFCGFVYYWFITKITVIALSEAGDNVVKFANYPAFLERITGQGGLDMPLEDANRLAQIFRVLKDV